MIAELPDPKQIEIFIRQLVDERYLVPRQSRICAPRVRANIKRLMSGEISPPIKVVDRVLCDGHHRYIAGLMYGKEPETILWELPTNYIVRKWQDIEVDLEMWIFD